MIYLDNAATTKPYESVVENYSKAALNHFYNPSGLYDVANRANLEIDSITRNILNFIGGEGEIVFNSGGTEGVNHVFNGVVIPKKSTILISQSEHDCVLKSAQNLEMQGYVLKYIPVDKTGKVIEEEYIKLLSQDVSLISVMHVCNETGCINDIERLVRLARNVNKKVVFHSDGVQAFLKIPLSMRKLDVDFYTVSAHKFHGLKGIGFLYKKKNTSLKPFILGGGQQGGLRSGTVSFPDIAALHEAIQKGFGILEGSKTFDEKRKGVNNYLVKLRNAIEDEIVNVEFLSPKDTCGILLVAFKGIRGEVLLHLLDKKNIIVGTGSACSGKNEGLYKKNLKLAKEYKDGIIRFSVSHMNKIEEIDELMPILKKSIEELREV